ncbi:unnamed protein product [Rhizophagus irregularis]|nr:unnamed protein product [Rhizophagus irregularis]
MVVVLPPDHHLFISCDKVVTIHIVVTQVVYLSHPYAHHYKYTVQPFYDELRLMLTFAICKKVMHMYCCIR